MKAIDAQGFEQKFRSDPDPWRYESARFEAFKRRILLHACGDRLYGRALELGCANGVTTQALARRCLRLDAVDASPTALRLAAARPYGQRRPRFFHIEAPAPLPRPAYDLIVVSELAYYLDVHALERLNQRLEAALTPAGRIVILHHLVAFADAAQRPAQAQARMRAYFAARRLQVARSRYARFEVVAFGR